MSSAAVENSSTNVQLQILQTIQLCWMPSLMRHLEHVSQCPGSELLPWLAPPGQKCPPKFRFVIWTCRDGKWLSRSLGHAGQASDYHCNRCLVNSDQTHLAAEPRTTEVHNSLAVYTAINPDRLVGEELYHLCKGSKTVQISSIDIGLDCYDELHMDINMSSVFVTLCQGILTVCWEGKTELPAALTTSNPMSGRSLSRFYPIAILREWWNSTSLSK